GLIRQKTEQLVVLHTQPAQVEPHKIGAFRYIGSRLRQTPGKKTYGKLHISADVIEHLSEPLVPFVVRRDERRSPEYVSLVYMVPAEFLLQRFTGLPVGRYDHRGRKPRDVEGLGRGYERDA